MASLPQELQPELQWSLLATKREPKDISTREIHQLALVALNKLCETQELFSSMMKKRSKFKKACKKPYLKIKCKEDKCPCGPPNPRRSRRPKGTNKKEGRRFKFFRRKRRGSPKSDPCFMCGEK
ncbi:hypothetical protein L484_007608 [Morus notabilis]|uniref:Uncharacterized protein n=1 Tax=Morus notabilis TaxID=981085 RepID=W9RT01_9ROSA|nr:hypothetical protein L484_007608 [Morus notabilis]